MSCKNQTDSDSTTTGVHCDPCLLLSSKKNAEHYCVECDEFFCNNCSSVHRMSKLSRNHKLLTQNDMPQRKTIPTEEDVCCKPREEILKYFCKVHKIFFCTVCVTLENRNCSIKYVDDIAPDFEKTLEYRSLIHKIKNVVNELKDIKKKSTRNGQDLQTVYSKFVSDVKAFRSEINRKLDSMEAAILKRAMVVKEFDMKAAQTVSTACDTMITDVNKIVNSLEKHKQYKQQRHLVMFAKMAEIQICEFQMKMAEMSNKNIIRQYSFHKNQKILLSLHSMYNLGTLVDKEVGGKTAMQKKKKRNLHLVNKGSKSVRASCVGQISVRHSEDKSYCDITGIVKIDPYRIALTDWNNYSVKLVNIESKSIVSYLQLSTRPWDVTCTDKSQLVVTCYNKLVFIDSRPTLTVNKELQLIGDCTGITFHDNQLFVSFDAPVSAVKSISLHGEILKTFSTDRNGQPLFKRPLYICLNYSKSTLFVSDIQTNIVTGLDLRGRIRNVYRDTDLKSPYGLTVDEYDNIYIAGFFSHNIHQISTQCTPVEILLEQKQGIEFPDSLMYCERENKLYISHGYGSSKRNVLSVYQLQ